MASGPDDETAVHGAREPRKHRGSACTDRDATGPGNDVERELVAREAVMPAEHDVPWRRLLRDVEPAHGLQVPERDERPRRRPRERAVHEAHQGLPHPLGLRVHVPRMLVDDR